MRKELLTSRSPPAAHTMPEQDPQSEADRAIIEWGWLLETVLGVALLGGTGMVVHYYTHVPLPASDLQRQVQQIRQQLDQMEQEHGMPAMVLNRYRNSICYIYGVYRVGFPGEPTSVRARISGNGFVVVLLLNWKSCWPSSPAYPRLSFSRLQ